MTNKEKPLFAFLITAAGSGTRVGGLKKEFRPLKNKPVIVHGIEAFLKSAIFSYGLITCKPGTINQVQKIIDNYISSASLKKDIFLCNGGKNRQESVFLGLKYLEKKVPKIKENGYVLIHDGARPWITTKLINKVSKNCILNNACAPIIPTVDAIKTIDNQEKIIKHLDRSETVAIQTPQGFSFKGILKSHQLANNDGNNYIDDTEIYSRYCGTVYTVSGEQKNRKITYTNDLPANETGDS